MNVGTITDGLCDENWKIGVYEYVHISLHRKIWYMQNMYSRGHLEVHISDWIV